MLGDPLFDAKQRYVRYVFFYNSFFKTFANNNNSCMEHSVDLSAKTFVQAVSPSSSRRLLRKIKTVLKVASEAGSSKIDIDDLDEHLADYDFEGDCDMEEIEAEGSDGEEDDAAADSIGKALLLVKQVSFV